MQALLAIPDRQRTEAQWDELIELEIMLAPGNREGAPQPGNSNSNNRRNPNMSQGGHPGGHPGKPGGGGQPHGGKKSGKKFHKRPPPKGNPQQGGG